MHKIFKEQDKRNTYEAIRIKLLLNKSPIMQILNAIRDIKHEFRTTSVPWKT